MTDPLAILRDRFVERCRADLAQIRAPGSEEALRLTVHRLAGSAGSFGFADLGALASNIDLKLAQAMTPTPEEYEGLLHALERAVQGRHESRSASGDRPPHD